MAAKSTFACKCYPPRTGEQNQLFIPFHPPLASHPIAPSTVASARISSNTANPSWADSALWRYVIRDFEPFDPPVVDLLHRSTRRRLAGVRAALVTSVIPDGGEDAPGAARISSSKGHIASGSIEGARSVFSTSPPSMDPHDLAIASSLSPSCGRPDRPWPSSAGGRAPAPRGRVRPASQRRRDTPIVQFPGWRSPSDAPATLPARRHEAAAVLRGRLHLVAWAADRLPVRGVQGPIRRVLDWHEVIDLRSGDGKAVCRTRPA